MTFNDADDVAGMMSCFKAKSGRAMSVHRTAARSNDGDRYAPVLKALKAILELLARMWSILAVEVAFLRGYLRVEARRVDLAKARHWRRRNAGLAPCVDLGDECSARAVVPRRTVHDASKRPIHFDSKLPSCRRNSLARLQKFNNGASPF